MEHIYAILYHYYDSMGYQNGDYTINLNLYHTKEEAVKALESDGYQFVPEEFKEKLYENTDLNTGENDSIDMIHNSIELNTDTILDNSLTTASIIEMNLIDPSSE